MNRRRRREPHGSHLKQTLVQTYHWCQISRQYSSFRFDECGKPTKSAVLFLRATFPINAVYTPSSRSQKPCRRRRQRRKVIGRLPAQSLNLAMHVTKRCRGERSMKSTNDSGSTLTPPKSMIVTRRVSESMRKLPGLISPCTITSFSSEKLTGASLSGGALRGRRVTQRRACAKTTCR